MIAIPANDPAPLQHAALCALHDYWQSRRPAPDLLPGRRHIDPVDMKFALGNLVLADVERAPRLRFKHRLIGVNIVARAGYDATGRYLDEIPEHALAERIMRSYERVVLNAAPAWARIDGIVDGRATLLHLLRLPLAADGANVDMVLSGAYFEAA